MAYWYMKRRVEHLRKVMGQTVKDIPDELIAAEEQHTKLTDELKKLIDSGASDKEIAEKRLDLSVVQVRYKRLMREYANG